MCYCDIQGEPGAWYAMLPLEMCYAYEPVPPEPQIEAPPLPVPSSFAVPLASAGSTPVQLPEVALVDSSVFESAAAAVSADEVVIPSPATIAAASSLQQRAASGATTGMSEASGSLEPAPMSPNGAPCGASTASDGSMCDSRDSNASPDSEPRGDESSELPTAEVDGGESELALEPPSLLPPDADWVLTREEARLILGAQANLWTEYVPDEATAEYMLLPRMCATAEVLWSPPARKAWGSFRARLPHVLAHCEALGIRHRPLT